MLPVPDPRIDSDADRGGTRGDDVEHGTGQAGADGERERVEGTRTPDADAIPDQGGAGPGTTAGEQTP